MAHASHQADHFDEAVRSGREAVDTIVKFGGSYMNTCPTQNYFGSGPLTREEVMNEIGRYVTDHGVKIGLHNEFFCTINLPNHRELVESTDPRYAHYCLDAEQVAIMGEALLTFYGDYRDRISTFPLKDNARQSASPTACAMCRTPRSPPTGRAGSGNRGSARSIRPGCTAC